MVTIKFSNQGMPPLMTATVRSLVAACCLWIFATWRGKKVKLSRADLPYGILIGVLFGLDFLFLYWGTSYTTASRAIIFLYTHPFWVALGATFVLHDDKLTLPKIVGLVMAFAGMIAVFGAGSDELPKGYWIGDLMEIAAAIFWGATTLAIKRVSATRPISHYQTLFAQLLYSVPVLAAGWLLFELGRPVNLSTTVLAALAFQCLVVAFFSYVLWFWMIHTYKVVGLTAFTFLTPMFGVIFGGLVLNDPLPPLLWAGLGLVAGGIYLVNKPVKVSEQRAASGEK
jgi:drug/metabolite transporter (DMT)-like permease